MRTINQPVIFRLRQYFWIVTGILLLFWIGINQVVAAQQKQSVVPLSTGTDIPDGTKYHWQPVLTGFVKPVELASPPGEPQKIVVVEQRGPIRMIVNGAAQAEPFLDIRDRVGTSANEQGLLGLAFHPQYAVNHYYYVNYTDHNGDTVIARFTASQDGMLTDASTETGLLQVDQPYDNHNGGGLAFGPDGYLYISLGDGGSAGDPQNHAQNLDSLLGKLLRVDVNVTQGYTIPTDNPFANGGGRMEIWAYGLRNPWKFSFDTLSGDLWIADVGQKLWEEVDYLPAGNAGGVNFGWNIMEGNHPYGAAVKNPGNLTNPIYEYDHATGCSITGGFVYRGISMPEWQGIYIFGDYCKGTIFGLTRVDSGVQVKQIDRITENQFIWPDGNGEIYALDHKSGTIYHLEPR